MRLCGGPTVRPARCAALPHVNAHTPGDVRWLACTEMPGFDNFVYLSDVAVRQAMSLLGYKTPVEVEGIEQELAQLRAECEEMRERLMVAESFVQAVDTIESADFRARRKPGRPRKEEVVA